MLVLGAVVLLLNLAFKTWEWSEDYFAVTSDRMLEASGVFTRKIAMMPLVKVTDMSFRRSTMGRLLGYRRVHPGIGRPGPGAAEH